MPPGAKQRRVEQERWELEKAERRRRLAEEDAAAAAAGGGKPRPPSGPSIRALARKWEPKLERHGSCCFNPLQKDKGVEVDDACLSAQCLEDSTLSRLGPGVKGLPMVVGGRYHYEVELLRACAVVVGWSAATSLPSDYDAQSFGYRAEGSLVGDRNGSPSEAYGLPFGRAGDVIGAFIDWPSNAGAAGSSGPDVGPKISFALNGRSLGVAFDLSAKASAAGFPPLQLHVCQAPGLAFKVLLRGACPSAPLRFPAAGFEPLGSCAQAHFCPFSTAVVQADGVRAELRRTDERGLPGKTPTVARRLIHGSLGLQLPLSHLAQEQHAERRGRCPSREASEEEAPGAAGRAAAASSVASAC